MKILLYILLLSINGVFVSVIAQQNPQPYFQHYSTNDGLPSSEVHCILEDSRGYLWIGTDNGAARFDGYTFETFDIADGLEKNVIHNILEDRNGRIWLSSLSGEVYIWDTDTIKPYPYNHIIQSYYKEFHGGRLNYLTKGLTAYFSLRMLGVLKIDNKGKDTLITSISPYTNLLYHHKELPNVLITEVARLTESEWDAQEKRIRQEQLSSFEFISDAACFSQELPAYTWEGGFNFIGHLTSTGELLYFHHGKLYCFQNKQLIWEKPFDFQAIKIVEDKKNSIWLCGTGPSTGLRQYNNLESLKTNQFEEYLKGKSISAIYQDHKGGLWVGTLDQGLYYATYPNIIAYDQSFGLAEDFVSTVAFKDQQNVYMGCKNGKIFLVDVMQNNIIQEFSTPNGYDNWDLFYDPQQQILWNSGKYWKNNKWNILSGKNAISQRRFPFISEVFLNQHFTRHNELIGCNHAGFFILDTKADTIKFDPHHFGLKERTYSVHTRLDSSVWVGNNRGLFKFEGNTLCAPNVDHPAFNNRVEDIDELPDSSLVFGTKGYGVIHWKGNEVLQLGRAEGLSSNMIEDVHVDESGHLWVGTLNGLNKISFSSNNAPVIEKFTLANGLASNEIYQIKSYAGQLWLCTTKGLIKFIEPPSDTTARPPIIRSLQINGESVSLQENSRFYYNQNNLEFNFLTINFRQNGYISYRYRIHPKDNWQYTTNRSINYARLSHGNYQFEIQSQNESGYWSKSTTYPFTIKRPWWKTWWAISMVIAVGVGGLVYYFLRRTAALKKETALLQQITKLERSALQAQMHPHFIFNSLNSIQNFILKNDKKRAVEYLSRFAKLVRYNLDLAIDGEVSLAKEVQLLDHYISLEQQRFNQLFDYHIEIAPNIDQYEVVFPPLLIQPYVENAIIHGLAPKKGNGQLNIHISKLGQQLLVKIKDNGIGYGASTNKNKHGFKSVGTSITKKRLALLGTEAEKAVKIKPILLPDQSFGGTEVSILISPKWITNELN